MRAWKIYSFCIIVFLGMMGRASQALSYTFDISGQVSRDLVNSPSVDVTVKITGVQGVFSGNTLANSSDAYNRFQIYASDLDSDRPIPAASSSTKLSADENLSYNPSFEFSEASPPVLKLNEDQQRYDIFFYLTIREKEAGKIKAAVKENQFNVIAQFSRELPKSYPFKDGEKSIVNHIPVANYVPIDTPTIEGKGLHQSVLINWDSPESIKYSDGKTRKPSAVQVFAFRYDLDAGKVDLSSAVRTFNGKTLEDTASGTCTLDPGLADGQSCVQCAAGPEGTYPYLDVKTLNEDFSNLSLTPSAPTPGGSVSVGDLDNGTKYIFVGNYSPDGQGFSRCLLLAPKKNTTLLEANGESEGQEKDPRCFVATAAFGSPFHPHVAVLRWFRSKVLFHLPGGRQFVRWYYRVSPPLAAAIVDRPVLKFAAQIAIAPAIAGAYLTRGVFHYPAAALVMLCLALTGAMLRRSQRRFATAQIRMEHP